MRDGQAVARPRDADIEETAFLLDCSLGLGALMGQEAVLGPDQPNAGELKSLCRMERDKCYPVPYSFSFY